MKKMDHIRWEDLFYYDETSPSCLRRKQDWRCGSDGRILKASAGSVAGTLNADGYYTVKVGGKSYLAHRIIVCLHGVKVDDLYVDHENGNRADSRFNKLRVVPFVANTRNRKLPSTSTSGVIGVGLNVDRRAYGTYYRWRAEWRDLKGKKCCKFFSISKLGNDEAFKQACEWRAKMIEELNRQGAGYTDEHGTKKT